MMSRVQKISFGFILLGIFCTGIFIGMIAEKTMQSEVKSSEFIQKEFSEKKTPVLSLTTIENGMLLGEILQGNIRLMIQENEVNILPEGKFTIDILPIFPMAKILPHPDGAKFVASKRGKNFWALDTPNAFLISAKNRKFFTSSQDAIDQGFKSGQK